MTALSLTFPVTVFIQPLQPATPDWQVLGEGPGNFSIPEGMAAGVRARNIDDEQLKSLLAEIGVCPALRMLNLAENRKISDAGLKRLTALTQLTNLNISSCDITNQGLAHLKTLIRLQRLDASYCNRLTDDCAKTLRALPELRWLNLQGCSKMTSRSVAHLKRPGLEIHK